MSKKSNKKLELEEKPPVEAGGMVSEEDLIARIQKVKDSEEKPELSMERVILFMAEKTHNMDKNLKELLDIFKGAKPPKPAVIEQPTEKVVAPSILKAPETPTEVVTTKPVSPRINEIVEAFKPVEAFVTVDTESSTQFVLVRPRGYLGKDDFAKVGAIARNIGAVYVKQGKGSHFRVPKIVAGEQPAKAVIETPQVESTGTIKDAFPENLAKLVSFIDEGGFTTIKPIKFLGGDNFAKIASIVKDNGGEYISAGKESRFKVPKK